jgi:hypothetical protein
MRLDSLKHLARVAESLAQPERIVVLGSASLLDKFPELGDDHGGPLATTFDADFIPEPWTEENGRLLHDTLAEDEAFHLRFGYYADILRPKITELFPNGWEDRLVPLSGFERVFCLEAHDMAAAKCQAGRPKDIELLALLISSGRIDPEVVTERLFGVAMREAMIVTSHRCLADAVELAAKRTGGD